MAAPVVPNGIVPELLKYYNFEDWSLRVKTYLMGKGIWEAVEEDGEAKSKEWRKNNANALHTIQYCCGDDAFSCISGLSTAKDAWDTLKEEFQRPGFIKIPDEGSDNVELEASEEEVDPGTEYRVSFFHHLERAPMDRTEFGAAMDLVRRYHKLIRARSPSTGRTILHTAVLYYDDLSMVKELVQLMKAKDLEVRDSRGHTALSMAIWNDRDIQIVKCMVEKNKNLLSMWLPPQNRIPVSHAFASSNWKLFVYFYPITPEEALNSVHGAEIISNSIIKEKLGHALDLISRFPNLAIVKDNNGGCPLVQLATTPRAFLSGSQLKFWEKWIYNDLEDPRNPSLVQDSMLLLANSTTKAPRYLSIYKGADMSQDHITVHNQRCRIFPGFSRIYQMKMNHLRFREILGYMCQVTYNMDVDQMRNSFVQKAFFHAVKRGNVEFITFMCKRKPELFHISDINSKSMFQFAVECRQEKIYNLLYKLDDSERDILTNRVDNFYNSMLHAAGSISPFAQLDSIQGPALQMQRELQWFKEVENIVPSHMVEYMNVKEGKKAHELFTESHRELVKAGESSMKDTATSCTVVGALIVTIMFAAAFTVPGGNNGNTGAPVFINKKLFMVFIASDAISLFSSTTSVMIFLGIFTSRYAEEDFLTSLPTKMIFGLLTLFISVTSMMIAFSSALFIMLHEPWIVGPVSFLASVPILTFVWMQFPLFAATLKSTYGRGIFNRKPKRRSS